MLVTNRRTLGDVVEEATARLGVSSRRVRKDVDKLKQKGEVYEPVTDGLRTT